MFSGPSYWLLKEDSDANGYPRLITQDDIDAALTWSKRKAFYSFKGDKYWRFTDRTTSQGYQKDISSWPGLPANLDAAFEFGQPGFSVLEI